MSFSWDLIGHANDVVAMAAINSKLFAATGDNRLWWRDPVAELIDGTIVRESSSPAVYGIFDGRRVLIPTPSALQIMGHMWDAVRVVPDGSLSGYPEARMASLSPTPGSVVFPPPNDPNPPYYGRHFVIPGVKGSIRVVSQGRELSIAELRGWLHPVPPGNLINGEPGWNDYHYTLELDSAWAASQGIDLNQILKVGNILEYPVDATGPDAYRQISNPHLGIEINGWKPNNDLGLAQPEDWRFPQDGSSAGQDFLNTTESWLADTRWPFDPRFPVGDNVWPYARVSGCLIADKEHGGGGLTAALRAWRAGMPNEAGEAPTRATEVHPPDLIEILPDHPRSETLRGVAVVAGTGAFESAEQELDARIAPLGPRPSPNHGIGVIELVGPETDLSTVVGGNGALNGALLQSSYYDIRLWIKVRRTGIGGRPGRFKAIYRVFWDIPGLPRPTGWWSQSGTLPLSAPDRIDYTITPNAVGSDAVEFVLEAGPGITWRKVLTVADGHGGSWDIVTKTSRHLTATGSTSTNFPTERSRFGSFVPLGSWRMSPRSATWTNFPQGPGSRSDGSRTDETDAISSGVPLLPMSGGVGSRAATMWLLTSKRPRAMVSDTTAIRVWWSGWLTAACSGLPSERTPAPLLSRGFVLVVGTAGFEPATPCSQSSSQLAPCRTAKMLVANERKPFS